MVACLVRDPLAPSVPGVLEAVARACSPRVVPQGDDAVLFDARGLARVLGTPMELVREVSRLAAGHGVAPRVAVAGTMTAAWLLAHARPGQTVDVGVPAAAVAGLPLGWLAVVPETLARTSDGQALKIGGPAVRRRRSGARHYRLAPGPVRGAPTLAGTLAVFERWGLRTLGDLARLPRAEIRTRFGPLGQRLHQAACGEDEAPLVPAGEAPRFLERLELEWPIDGLEPLAFVLSRLCETLSGALERADRGAIVVTTRLWLVTRTWHERVLHLPAPMREARVLRTLVLLDLESHPPDAAIDAVEVEAEVAPGQVVQGSLLARALPSAENLATLIARLGALMGETRVGVPVCLDTHDARAVGMARFAPVVRERPDGQDRRPGRTVLRRFRLPVAARVAVEAGRPVRVQPSARGLPAGRVIAAAGPWRSSGRWWAPDDTGWNRDEWDVELEAGIVYRLTRDRVTGQWAIEGAFD
jgi:protein ImuB